MFKILAAMVASVGGVFLLEALTGGDSSNLTIAAVCFVLVLPLLAAALWQHKRKQSGGATAEPDASEQDETT